MNELVTSCGIIISYVIALSVWLIMKSKGSDQIANPYNQLSLMWLEFGMSFIICIGGSFVSILIGVAL